MIPEMHSGHHHRVTKPFFTFGTLTLLIIMGIGFSFGITRLLLGLGAVTHLNDYSLKFQKPLLELHAGVKIVLPVFIVAGAVLSFMHQSSLGALMLISPTKLSPLWNIPILPVLFLMSAIMVGFPMVILESIYANISLGRAPEMNLLTPLARKIPWFIGAYGIVKIGDLVFRYQQLDFLSDPAATILLVVEIFLGVIAPFLLFLNKAVRHSMGWLFFTISLVISGVIINRINVFLVGYHPPYAIKDYYPSAGEIAMTMAIVCSILFCYRLFVTLFPVLPGHAPTTEMELAASRNGRENTVSPLWTWVVRGTAIACLLGFVMLYSVVHLKALRASATMVQGIERVRRRCRQRPAARRSLPIPSVRQPTRTFISWTASCSIPNRTSMSRSDFHTASMMDGLEATAEPATTASPHPKMIALEKTSRHCTRPWISNWEAPVRPVMTTWNKIRPRAATGAMVIRANRITRRALA